MSVRIIFILYIMISALAAQERQVLVHFDDLPRLLEESSPQQSIIKEQRLAMETKRNAALQWSNPEINYGREQVESSGSTETEELIYVSKTFSLPWNYLQERRVWKDELSAAGAHYSQESHQLLASVRTEYVRLSLLNELTDKQSKLSAILDDLTRTVEARREEGALSQIEAALLSMSMFGLESEMIQTQQAYRHSGNTMKQLLGIDPLSQVRLSTSIIFKPIPIQAAQNTDFAKNHPGLNALRMRLSAMNRRVTLERSKILPSLSLQGGYKKINPGWEGYTLGLSIPLPFLNWNGPQIQEQKIKQRIQTAETILYQQRLQSLTDNLVKTIQSGMVVLQKYRPEQNDIKIAEDLLATYREGAMTLSEFLNAIQIYREGSRQYTEQLIAYYEAAFELETLIGQQLVKF